MIVQVLHPYLHILFSFLYPYFSSSSRTCGFVDWRLPVARWVLSLVGDEVATTTPAKRQVCAPVDSDLTLREHP